MPIIRLGKPGRGFRKAPPRCRLCAGGAGCRHRLARAVAATDAKDATVNSLVPRFLMSLSVVSLAVGASGWSAVAQQIPVFKSGVDLVNVGVTVTDRKGNLVTDLKADDFEIYED